MATVRELVLDTETTGFSPENGDKIVEIGIVELVNHLPTNNHFHKYINPQRSMPESAFKVHGLSYDFLKDKPLFVDVAEEMSNFIKTDQIIIHNASFDLSFLNSELTTISRSIIDPEQVIDTLKMARDKFPGSPASLDALCRRFLIDTSNRKLHGALLDSYILAKVYLELIGGKQPDFELGINQTIYSEGAKPTGKEKNTIFNRKTKLGNRVSEKESLDHETLIRKINGLKNWNIYN